MTFADNKYQKSLSRIEQQARHFCCITDCCVYKEKDIDKDYLHIINPWIHRRGFGYWRWKPYFVKKVFDQLNNGDVLFWADAGCVLNNKAEDVLCRYIEKARETQSGFFVFQQSQIEKEWTKNDLFEYLHTGNKDKESGQLWAGAWIVVKTPLSQKAINQWYDICRYHEDLVTDKRSETPNDVNFQEHRWDQSVFSLVVKATDSYASIPYQKNENDPIIGARKKELTQIGKIKQRMKFPWRFFIGCYLQYCKDFYFKEKVAW